LLSVKKNKISIVHEHRSKQFQFPPTLLTSPMLVTNFITRKPRVYNN
jgi:hypothetical protein